jgi:outer membrane protein assembly factor BamB
MSKQFWYAFSSLVLVALLVSACQPTVAVTETPTTAPLPTVSPTASPVSTTVPTPEAVWTFQTGAAIWGTPAISDGTVYFGSDDGNLYAVDAQNGSLRWKFLTQGIVRSRPAIVGELVYFASDDGYLYAVEAQSGTQAWRTDFGNSLPRDGRKLGTSPDPTTFDYLQSSPVVVDGQIYIGSLDRNVYALAADTGKINWTYKTGQKVRATPTPADGVLYIGSWDESMYALDALSGQMLWNTPVGGEVQTTALVANGLVYTASRKASVVALDAQTGEKKWEYDYGHNLWVESSPQLVGNVIYIGGSGGNKMVLGLDSQTGKASSFFFSIFYHWSTPTIVDDTLYIGGNSLKADVNKGGLLALKLVDGKISDHEYWFFPVPGQETLESYWSGVASSPVVQNGVIYFGGLDGILYALSTAP